MLPLLRHKWGDSNDSSGGGGDGGGDDEMQWTFDGTAAMHRGPGSPEKAFARRVMQGRSFDGAAETLESAGDGDPAPAAAAGPEVRNRRRQMTGVSDRGRSNSR